MGKDADIGTGQLAQQQLQPRQAAYSRHAASIVTVDSAPLYRALFCFAVLAAARVLPLPDSHGQIAHVPDFCPFYRLTGIPCPGCGMTRSLVCLMHGRWAESWAYHPLGWAVAAALLAYGAASIANWRGAKFRPLAPRTKALLPYIGIIITLGIWAARLAGWDALPR